MDPKTFFTDTPKLAVAFSGGVDSACLLLLAKNHNADVQAYYARSAFQPRFELEDAREIAAELTVPLKIIDIDILAHPGVRENSPSRCYHCKHALFTKLKQVSLADGFPILADGTNASDDEADRPGMRALRELGVRSPLRECGITKDDARQILKQAGLKVWDKPAYACLATRLASGRPYTSEILQAIEESEDLLFDLGFSDFRVRTDGERAILQVPADQMPGVIAVQEQILAGLSRHFSTITLDLEARK